MVFIKYKNKTTHLLTITNMTRKILAIVVLMTTLFATSSFATGTEQPQILGWRQWIPTMPKPLDDDPKTPRGTKGSAGCRYIYIDPNVSINPRFGNLGLNIGYGSIKNGFGKSISVGYKKQVFNDVTLKADYEYQRLVLPVTISYAPSPIVHIGLGAEYQYLVNAKVNNRPITLNNNTNFERHGLGVLADANFGWSDKSPRLGVRYTYKFGASQKNHDYGFSELYVRIPINLSK
jgi:hypothetical protein